MMKISHNIFSPLPQKLISILNAIATYHAALLMIYCILGFLMLPLIIIVELHKRLKKLYISSVCQLIQCACIDELKIQIGSDGILYQVIIIRYWPTPDRRH